MSNDILAIFLDIIVLTFLGATIFYVMRLYRGLNEFKAQRREFDGIITNLLSSIDQAERSIQTLKQVSTQEAAELEQLIQQSRAMSEELKIINEAGESMAQRLEKAAEESRKIAQSSHALKPSAQSQKRRPPPRRAGEEPNLQAPPEDKKRKENYTTTLKNIKKPDKNVDMPSFMLQDRDSPNTDNRKKNAVKPDNNTAQNNKNTDNKTSENLQSQAERELFDALRTRKHHISGKERS